MNQRVDLPIEEFVEPDDLINNTSPNQRFDEVLHAGIKRRSVPDECFRDKGLMSKWLDGNR